MSKSDILYVKDMNMSEGEGEEGEDIWDDRKLNDAYDKALKMANAEVAKRVAMSTNSQSSTKQVSDSSQSKKGQSSKSNIPNSQKKKQKWKTGMPCRAVYEEDGLEYEACVLTMVNDKKCVVRFLGYNNSEIVPSDSLKPTLGEKARMRQIEEALGCEDQNENMSLTSQTDSVAENSEAGGQNLLEAEHSSSKRSKSPKKKKRNKNQRTVNGFNLPEMPFTMPNISMLMNAGGNEMPLPPPPPLLCPPSATDAEEQAVSSMLLSWYMSGYYTGLYQGLKRSKENGRNK